MKKIMSMILAVAMCIAVGIPAYATSNDTDQWGFAENNEDSTDIEEMAFTPPTTDVFKIEELRIYPVYVENGQYKHGGYHWYYRPASTDRNVNFLMTLDKQQKLIDYEAEKGHEVVGWYLAGDFYCACYGPIRLDYRVYNDKEDGRTLYGRPFSTMTSKYVGTATISTTALFPKDMSQSYTYGFDGSAMMNVYPTGMKQPEYTLKVTFEVK